MHAHSRILPTQDTMEMSQRDAEWEESGADLLDAPVVLSQSPGSQLSMGGGADAMDEVRRPPRTRCLPSIVRMLACK